MISVSLARFWLSTLRIRLCDSQIPRQNAIIALWHEHQPILSRVFRNENFAVLISKSRDGDLAAGLCQGWGYHVYRGSSSKGGTSGMKQLLRHLQDPQSSHLAGMALDGPRGPYHSIQPGTVWLSQTTGIPIYPVTLTAKPSIALKNWDRTVIPMPFARVEVTIGKPMIPRGEEELRETMCFGR
jgi:lysophospholipid acyltransferase (LPLAT)-like uncharacterized protein